jgi:hypothetical protein
VISPLALSLPCRPVCFCSVSQALLTLCACPVFEICASTVLVFKKPLWALGFSVG